MSRIIAVLGKKESGKTSVIEGLVRLFPNGTRVAAVKHIHRPDFDVDSRGTDTWRMFEAGASPVLASSSGKLALFHLLDEPRDLDQLLGLLKSASGDVDVVFLEGFRSLVAGRRDVEKIIVARSAEEAKEWLSGIEEPVLAVVLPDEVKAGPGLPRVFRLGELGELSSAILGKIKLPFRARRVLKQIDPFDALSMAMESVRLELGTEELPVTSAVGRILSERITATRDIPGADEAFYDGYALISSDTADAKGDRPVMIEVVGTLGHDDSPDSIELREGQAALVHTGSPVPRGADAVLRLEQAVTSGDRIVVRRRVKPGEYIVRSGEDVRAGDVLFERGHAVRPQDLGMLMQQGIGSVRVLNKLRVSVISCGDELLEKKGREPSSFPDSHAHMLVEFLRAISTEPSHLGIVPDDIDHIRRAIKSALRSSDALLMIGGASIGERDLVEDALLTLGTVVFHGVNMSPGKVSGVAVIEGKPVFMVPGHVTSAVACFCFYVAPVLVRCGYGLEWPYPRVKAKLKEDLTNQSPRYSFKMVTLSRDGDCFYARPTGDVPRASRRHRTIVDANGFLVLGPRKGKKRGEEVDVSLFSPLEIPNLEG